MSDEELEIRTFKESYNWEGDNLDIARSIVRQVDDARTETIIDHFKCDMSDFREWLEWKKKPWNKLCNRCANNGKWSGCNPDLPLIHCLEFVEKPLTNGAKVRSMTDEELAVFLDDISNGCDNCPKRRYCLFDAEEENCRDVFLKWLKQEVEE